MPRRKPVPTLWLMTDERMGDELWHALRRLPPHSGVVLRHGATDPRARRRLLRRIRRMARARRLLLVVAGGASGADGSHNHPFGHGLRTAAAHDRRQALRAVRAGADLLFVSPLFATRSHPGARPAGPARAARIAANLDVTAIALGGMDRRRFLRVRHWGFDGWAAIDALLPSARQKRKAVPT